ncbi:restriction endonuclease subunit S [Clostridium perfringens]|uniref:restriction endonuclease subunit S n=1 Tax=Clostridium perfringens TaxID=1502 RepID=UPI00224617F7|nr:restriction endonuclease subunit S [Clostridium perfringens]MCX0388636.1 restriction endonuclease subunit S [Clostridium perfringens]MDK0557585.1 restriction endonuclease subunit S [Clostridium perfringens]
MNVYKLKEIFIEFKDGDWIESKNQSEDGIRLIQTGNIGNGIYIEKSTKAKFVSEKTMEELNCNEIFEGDILISRLPSPVGRACILPNLRTRAITAVDCTIGRIDYKICNRKYFIYFTMSDDYSRQINKFVVGTTRKRISRKNLEEINISLPNIAIQNKIVEKLDIALELINKRKLQIKELDLLVKSKFIEMFGNPFDSTKWLLKKLKEVSISISDGSNIDKKYYQKRGEVLFLRIQNVWCNEFRLEDSVYISENVNQDYIDTSLCKGDLLITKIGRFYTKDSSLGRVSLYLGENDKANYSNNIMRVRLKDEVLSEYVNALLNLDDYNQYIRRVSVGGTDKRALSKTLIGDFPIIVPPIELQKKFIGFVKQVDKLKVEIENSLKQLEDNFNSLTQRVFKGELFN